MHVFAPDVTVPLLGEDGKVAMESPYKVARAPGGSGEGRGGRALLGYMLLLPFERSYSRMHPPSPPTLLSSPPLPSPHLPSLPLPSGEVFRGLRESGMLAHMRRAGVRCLDVHAVEDNIMAKIADPTFLGE